MSLLEIFVKMLWSHNVVVTSINHTQYTIFILKFIRLHPTIIMKALKTYTLLSLILILTTIHISKFCKFWPPVIKIVIILILRPRWRLKRAKWPDVTPTTLVHEFSYTVMGWSTRVVISVIQSLPDKVTDIWPLTWCCKAKTMCSGHNLTMKKRQGIVKQNVSCCQLWGAIINSIDQKCKKPWWILFSGRLSVLLH